MADEDPTNPVIRYYNRTESRVGYQLFLGGTKHFGLYEPGESMWSFGRSLRRMEDRLAEALSLPAGSDVLDAGSGMGDVASRLAGSHGLKVTGIDLLDFNIEEARKRAVERGLEKSLTFALMDYSNLRFEDQSFDGVYTMETLVHAVDADKVLREFMRVLRPGGRLALFEYSRKPDEEISSRSQAAFARVNDLAAMPSFQRFNFGVLERLLENAGFENVDVEDVTSRMLPMVHAFSIVGQFPYAVGRVIGKTNKVVNAMSAVEFWKHRSDFKYSIYTATKPSR